MGTWRILAIALAGLVLATSGATAQQPSLNPFAPQNNAPPYKYSVTPQAGEWLICVQTFTDFRKDDRSPRTAASAQALAEELAECIRRDYKLPAYLYDRGRKDRLEEEARIQKFVRQYWNEMDKLRAQGLEPIGGFRYRCIDIPDQFAVLVGKPNRILKDIDAARDFLNDVRKLAPPPEKFALKAVFADEDPSGKKVTKNGSSYINPFTTAMPVHNPSMSFEKKQEDPEKADDFLKQVNANNEFNLLKCSKPWTLVVKVYQGQTLMQPPKSPSIMTRLGFGKKEPELLNANGAQAMATAEFLRKMKPSFEAYVLHGRSYSLVTVGQFDSATDPNLLAAQRTLAAMQIKDQGVGVALETLNAQPLPMKIPR